MRNREALGVELREALGNNNVYYQPPSNIKLKYPCIIYSSNNMEPVRANNGIYKLEKSYNALLISQTDLEDVKDSMMRIRFCSHDRSYIADNLYHESFTIYL